MPTIVQLQELAVRSGIGKTGTKAVVLRRLMERIQNHKPIAPGTRVLSIDVGIRNLAFSLVVPTKVESPSRVKPAPTSPETWMPEEASTDPISVFAWARLSLDTTSGVPQPPATDGQPRPLMSPAIEDFTPMPMSQMTVRLVEDVFLPLKPTHVLIERQRYRSGGAPAVFDWVMRANMMESMLYATFTTLKSCKLWNGTLVPIAPKSVGALLLQAKKEDQGEGPSLIKDVSKANSKASGIKEAKVGLLASWISSGDVLRFSSHDSKAMAELFVQQCDKKRKPKNSSARVNARDKSLVGALETDTASATVKKLDDLADCLLQGVAWVRWQNNVDLMVKLAADRESFLYLPQEAPTLPM